MQGRVIVGIACCLFMASAQAEDNKEKAPGQIAEFGAAADGYRRNRESFPFFTCRFTVTIGKAQSILDALDEKFIDPVVSQGRWVVDDNNVKYTVGGDPAVLEQALAQPPVHNAVTLPFDTEEVLTDGVNELRYASILKCANIWPPGVPGPGIGLTPFDIGIMAPNDVLNPGRMLRDCAEGKRFGVYDGTKRVDGAEIQMFSIGRGDDLRVKYLIDPNKGFNPVEVIGQSANSRPLDYRAFFAYRPCPENRWFADRGLVVYFTESGRPPFPLRQVKLVEFNAETRPAKEEFTLDLPPGTQVSDPNSKGGFYYVKKPEHIGLADLRGMFERCAAKAAGGPTMLTQRTTAWIYASCASGLVAAGALCVWLYYRKRRPSRKPAV